MKKHVLASALLGAALAFGTALPVLAEDYFGSTELPTNPTTDNSQVAASAVTTNDTVFQVFNNLTFDEVAEIDDTLNMTASTLHHSPSQYKFNAVSMFGLDGDATQVKGTTIGNLTGVKAGDEVVVYFLTDTGESALLTAVAGDGTVKITGDASGLDLTAGKFVVIKATGSDAGTPTNTWNASTETSTTTKTGYSVPNTADRG